jgi:very-short-patch-repair endonuclease
LWGLLPPQTGPVDVTVAARDCGRRSGIREHRVRALARADVRRRERLPITAPARTLLDVAGVVDADALGRALNEAVVQRLTSEAELRALLERSKRRLGSPALRDLLERLQGPTLTRSEAEGRLLALLDRAQLSRPETNVKVGRYEVDLLWRRERLVVEVDGFAFHSTRAAFERDRVRDAELQARGLRVVRITWRQIVDEPEATIARVAILLGTAAEETNATA